MPGIKNGCHVGCPAIGLFMTSVRGGGACASVREKAWKKVRDREIGKQILGQ